MFFILYVLFFIFMYFLFYGFYFYFCFLFSCIFMVFILCIFVLFIYIYLLYLFLFIFVLSWFCSEDPEEQHMYTTLIFHNVLRTYNSDPSWPTVCKTDTSSIKTLVSCHQLPANDFHTHTCQCNQERKV